METSYEFKKIEIDATCNKHKTKMYRHEKKDGSPVGPVWCKMCKQEIESSKHAEFGKMLLAKAGIPPRFRDKTLENYDVSTSEQRKVMEHIKQFLENWETSTGLIFIGKPGTGKNHLACAIAIKIVETHCVTALVTTAWELTQEIKSTWNRESRSTTHDVMRKYRDVGILVIDEINMRFGSDTEKALLFQVIDSRYSWLKPTILMGNLEMTEAEELLGEQVIDRFREGKACVFNWDSYRKQLHTKNRRNNGKRS